MPYAKIISTGSATPDNVVTNHDLEKFVDTNDEWIVSRTGIKERRISKEGTTASDLAVEATQNALDMVGLKATDIDLIIVATTTPDYNVFPSTGALVQDKLGANKIPAFDISAACTGFIYGLSTATAFIRSGMYKRVLHISVDLLSKHLDWDDRTTCVLFGDAAAALIIEATDNQEEESILSIDMHANGGGKNLLMVPEGGTQTPFNKDTFENRGQFIKMDGPAVYKFAVNVIVDSVTTALHSANLEKEDITMFVPHQANKRIINFAAKKLSLREDQIKMNLDMYGNTSSASIPLLLDLENRAGNIKKGDIVATVGFGAGLTWGSAIIKW